MSAFNKVLLQYAKALREQGEALRVHGETLHELGHLLAMRASGPDATMFLDLPLPDLSDPLWNLKERVEQQGGVPGSPDLEVTPGVLMEWALENGYTELCARKLSVRLNRELYEFFRDHGVSLLVGSEGGWMLSSLKKAVVSSLEDLRPQCVKDYGDKQHDLLMAFLGAH